MKKILSFLVGLVIFCGLPLLGWGLNDLSGYFRDPIRLSFLILMTILSVLVVIFVPNEGRGSGEGKNPLKRQKLTILVLQIMPVLILLISPYSDHRGIWVMQEKEYLRLLGLIVSFAGFGLMNWSVMVLGKQFSVDVTIQEGHKLITTGPYRIMRHPRYLGVILFFTGISLVYLSWISLCIAALLVPVLLWRIRDEEKMMEEEFGEDWQRYKKMVKW